MVALMSLAEAHRAEQDMINSGHTFTKWLSLMLSFVNVECLIVCKVGGEGAAACSIHLTSIPEVDIQ